VLVSQTARDAAVFGLVKTDRRFLVAEHDV